MVKALVTGGYFDQRGEGVVWHVDFETGRADVLLRWSPPKPLLVPTKGFAGGSLSADRILYVAAHAAVLRVDPTRAVVTGILHQPCMNDLHHVAVEGDRLYVANTGLSSVDVFGIDGSFRGSHTLLPAWANERRFRGQALPEGEVRLSTGWSGEPPEQWAPDSRNDGYLSPDRRAAPFHRLKLPDYLHVNHVARVGGRRLATCFADGTLRDLSTFEVVARFSNAFLHDGFAAGDGFWLTAIDGTVRELDAETLEERRALSTFDSGHHGWCRGLAVVGEAVLVGLTEVRRGTLPRHRWAERDPEGSETSVLMLDRADGRLLARIELTDAERHSKVYSVLALDGGKR